MRCAAVLAAGLSLALPVFAEGVSEAPDSAVVTIYHDGEVKTSNLVQRDYDVWLRKSGLAFITETRTIDLPAGPARIEFRGVASTIVPQTADVTGLPAEMLERNFDYDLLSPGSLLEKSIGKPVRLVRMDDKGRRTEQTAIVRSAPSGTVLEIGGKFEAVGCSGLKETVVLDAVPHGLRDTPTLSIRTRAREAGRYQVKLSYIATGMNWSADYVARIRPDGRTLDLTGWITLANFGDTGFEQVPVQVVAGHVEQTGESVPADVSPKGAYPNCWTTKIDWATHVRSLAMMQRLGLAPPPAPPPPPMRLMKSAEAETVVVTGYRASMSQLGDYKMYSLPVPTDVLARQTKQVQFLEEEGVPFERFYEYSVDSESSEEDVPAATALRMQNTQAGKLAKPLPAGVMAVFETGETPVLTGADRIDDTPIGLPVELTVGRAMEVRVTRLTTKEEKTGWFRKRIETTREIIVSNGKPAAIAFELHQPMEEGLRVTSESERYVVKPKGATWSFTLQPGERKLIRYVLERPV